MYAYPHSPDVQDLLQVAGEEDHLDSDLPPHLPCTGQPASKGMRQPRWSFEIWSSRPWPTRAGGSRRRFGCRLRVRRSDLLGALASATSSLKSRLVHRSLVVVGRPVWFRARRHVRKFQISLTVFVVISYSFASRDASRSRLPLYAWLARKMITAASLVMVQTPRGSAAGIAPSPRPAPGMVSGNAWVGGSQHRPLTALPKWLVSTPSVLVASSWSSCVRTPGGQGVVLL